MLLQWFEPIVNAVYIHSLLKFSCFYKYIIYQIYPSIIFGQVYFLPCLLYTKYLSISFFSKKNLIEISFKFCL